MTPYYQDDYCTIYHGNCLEVLPQLGEFESGAFVDVRTLP